MVRYKRCDALLALLITKDNVSSILTNIRTLKADERKSQLLLLFERLVRKYETAIHATRAYLHVSRSCQSLRKSFDKLKEYLEKFIKPYLLG